MILTSLPSFINLTAHITYINNRFISTDFNISKPDSRFSKLIAWDTLYVSLFIKKYVIKIHSVFQETSRVRRT